MGFFNAKTCCCCADLKTGGLIIGYVEIFLSLSSLLSASGNNRVVTIRSPNGHQFIGKNADYTAGSILFALLILVIQFAWLYGIHCNKPKFMLPSFVLSFVEMVVCIIFSIFILFGITFGMAIIFSMLPQLEGYAHSGDSSAAVFIPMILIFLLIFGSMFAFFWHILKVKGTLYYQMSEASPNQQVVYVPTIEKTSYCA